MTIPSLLQVRPCYRCLPSKHATDMSPSRWIVFCLVALFVTATSYNVLATPRTVHFESLDHKTKLVGYVWDPSSPGPHPAVVLLHGRAGPYSSLAKGVYSAETLSKRHKEWGEYWATRGYTALLVDSF